MDGDAGFAADADSAVDERVMGDHQHIVLGDGQVQFQDIRALLNCITKSRDRVLGTPGASASVAVHKDFRAVGNRERKWR
jgi:hypothetical protein